MYNCRKCKLFRFIKLRVQKACVTSECDCMSLVSVLLTYASIALSRP